MSFLKSLKFEFLKRSKTSTRLLISTLFCFSCFLIIPYCAKKSAIDWRMWQLTGLQDSYYFLFNCIELHFLLSVTSIASIFHSLIASPYRLLFIYLCHMVNANLCLLTIMVIALLYLCPRHESSIPSYAKI